MRLLFLLFSLILSIAYGAALQPITFGNGATSYFRDDSAEKGRAGWILQGANDLRILASGELNAGGVTFQIGDDNAGKSCIVLGGKQYSTMAQKTEVQLPTPQQAKILYLLHAAAFAADLKPVGGLLPLVGKLKVTYVDGTSSDWRVRQGRDVNDWYQSKTFGNAVRAWSQYNNNSQVSLFVSKFKLEPKAVKAITFDSAEAVPVWMIAAATLGDDIQVNKIKAPATCKPVDGPVAEPALIAALPATGVPKNVIMIIGDGMGFECLKAASISAHGESGKLVMEQFPVKTECETLPANGPVTDSAASGTAIGGGYKTNNGMIGMDPCNISRKSIATCAKELGKSVGIVTTDNLYGATPAAFFAHAPSRGMYAEIMGFAPTSNFEVLIGSSGTKKFLFPKSEKGSGRNDERNIVQELIQRGYTEIPAATKDFPKSDKLFGWFNFSYGELGKVASDTFELLNKNPKGFFVMVECSWPDYGGHGNDPEKTVVGGLETDNVAKAALEFASRNPDTLIIVTADHETGKVSTKKDEANPRVPLISYDSTGHSERPVPFYAVGPGSQKFQKKMRNVYISAEIAKMWKVQTLGANVIE